MSDNTPNNGIRYIEEDLAVRWPLHEILSTGVTSEMIKFYAHEAAELKGKIDGLAAEVTHRQDKMRYVNDILAEINNLTDDKNCLNITDHPDLIEKLNILRNDYEVKIPENLKFTSNQRDRLVENLHLTADGWDKENKNQTQKMEIFTKVLDRYMMMLKEIQRDEKTTKQHIINNK